MSPSSARIQPPGAVLGELYRASGFASGGIDGGFRNLGVRAEDEHDHRDSGDADDAPCDDEGEPHPDHINHWPGRRQPKQRAD